MALQATAIVTIDEAREACKLRSSEEDPELERLVHALTNTFELETGRYIKKRTVTDYRVDGNGLKEILLPVAPVQAVTKIEVRSPTDDTVYKTITDPTKFVLKDKRLGLLMLKEESFLLGLRNILLTMDVGFEATDLDFINAKDLLLMQLNFSFKLVKQNEIGLQSKSFGDGSISFFPVTRLLREVKDGLVQLKHWTKV